jgi:ferredoxin-NADP reductase
MTAEFLTTIQSIRNVTHDVKSFRLEKPAGYHFNPGQATEVSINKPGWEDEKRPFTFTSLNEDPYLEFTIKIYPDHKGVTNELNGLKAGDQLVLRDVWGAIAYRGAGYFIAGGAGITPFIAILRQLSRDGKLDDNQLFFSNKTDDDVILEDEFRDMMGENAIFLITDKPSRKHHSGFIDETFLRQRVSDFSKPFYLCGPPGMVEAMEKTLLKLGAKPDSVVFEK